MSDTLNKKRKRQVDRSAGSAVGKRIKSIGTNQEDHYCDAVISSRQNSPPRSQLSVGRGSTPDSEDGYSGDDDKKKPMETVASVGHVVKKHWQGIQKELWELQSILIEGASMEEDFTPTNEERTEEHWWYVYKKLTGYTLAPESMAEEITDLMGNQPWYRAISVSKALSMFDALAKVMAELASGGYLTVLYATLHKADYADTARLLRDLVKSLKKDLNALDPERFNFSSGNEPQWGKLPDEGDDTDSGSGFKLKEGLDVLTLDDKLTMEGKSRENDGFSDVESVSGVSPHTPSIGPGVSSMSAATTVLSLRSRPLPDDGNKDGM